jgi:WD40-like Beta Propeller Repeat
MHVRAAIITVFGLATVPGAWRPLPAQESAPAPASHKPAPDPKDDNAQIEAAVRRLADALRQHPAQPSKASDRVAGLYMIEVATGEVTLIADEPDPGTTFCGSATWSSDGKRILFDAMRPEKVALAHMKAIELVGGRLTVTDLGVGNCPAFSPAGDQIAFLLNGGGVPGARSGIWLMRADGSERRRLNSWGRPFWSPDGRQFMTVNFSIPAQVTLMDVKSLRLGVLQPPEGMQIYSVPRWASAGAIVAVVGAGFGDTIALLDVTEPARGKIKEVLWKRNFKGKDIGANPNCAAYMPSTGRGVFVGATMEGMALYSFERGQSRQPRRLEPSGLDALLQDVALSPDGRFALFSSNRTGARHRGSAPAPPKTVRPAS